MTEEQKALADIFMTPRKRASESSGNGARKLNFDYNSLRPSREKEREEIIRREMRKTGRNSGSNSPFTVISGAV